MLARDVDDIRPSDRLILRDLEADDRRLVPQGDLVEMTALPAGTVTTALDRLADRDIVDRIPDPSDARRKVVTITADTDTEDDTGDDVSIPRRPEEIEG